MCLDSQALKEAEALCGRCRTVLGENLASFALYGSAVRGNMVPGRSDINVLIVLERSTPEAHRALAELLRAAPRVAPFVLSRWELPRSRSVFALKFASIARNYKLLFGEDPLADFAPSRSLLLFLCEQSLRNLRLRLKHDYMRHANQPGLYGEALARAGTSLIATLSEVLRSSGLPVPDDVRQRAAPIGAALSADASVLDEILALRRTPDRKLTADEAFDLHARLFRLLSASLDKVREQWPQAVEIQ